PCSPARASSLEVGRRPWLAEAQRAPPVLRCGRKRQHLLSEGWKCMRAGVRQGLQILRVCLWWTGRFDSDSLPPALLIINLDCISICAPARYPYHASRQWLPRGSKKRSGTISHAPSPSQNLGTGRWTVQNGRSLSRRLSKKCGKIGLATGEG